MMLAAVLKPLRKTLLPRYTTAAFNPALQTQLLAQTLQDSDPLIYSLIQSESLRQHESINLIPSENYTSRAVMQALGSIMQNKYSEGLPGLRYYGGNQFIDQVERLCQHRALDAFQLDPELWGCNVQPLSGSPANLYVYNALLKPHERIMCLDLPHGGHLSHGYQVNDKKISAVSAYFETLPYILDPKTGLVDYDALENTARLYRPKLLIAGASAYSRNFNYPRMRAIADQVGAYLLADIAHISGFVAAGHLPSPFKYADVVTTTTHKSLRGPRGAIIFFRKGTRSTDKKTGTPITYNLESPINASVFPGHQGGPHNHTITALAVALAQVKSDWFKIYSAQALSNNQMFAKTLMQSGYELLSGGTDNHLVVVNLKPNGIDGARVERVLELANITANKNTVPGDKSALIPGGVRMGTPAMTTRGLVEKDFVQVAIFVHRAVQIASQIAGQVPGKKVRDFYAYLLESADSDGSVDSKFPALKELQLEVVDFARSFPSIDN